VVRSHYGNDRKNLVDREKIYRASNAIAAWLGLASWTEIVFMQQPANIEQFKQKIAAAN
jgi:hypothetical protein